MKRLRSFLETRGAGDVWLVKVGGGRHRHGNPGLRAPPCTLSGRTSASLQFYAPWCSFCKQLDPVWHQIGSELKSRGSPINVGKCDGTASIGEAAAQRSPGPAVSSHHLASCLRSVGQGLPCPSVPRHPHVSPVLGDAAAGVFCLPSVSVFPLSSVLRLKNGMKYNYPGPRTKDAIMDFADRVGGWRSLLIRHPDDIITPMTSFPYLCVCVCVW